MTVEAEKLLEAALRLPDGDRAHLAGRLLDSLDVAPAEDAREVEAAWTDEIKRRSQELDSGQVKSVPWEQVRAKLWEGLGGVPD